AGRPTECPRSSGIAALLIIWTTGARRADTNGPTGITRCGSTSARTTKEPPASLESFTMAKKLTGGSASGSIPYKLVDKPMFVHCCHCDDCHRLTGSAFVLNAIIEAQAIKLLRGKPVAVPVPRENGPHDIYRCPKCQTAVWSDYGRRPNLRFV